MSASPARRSAIGRGNPELRVLATIPEVPGAISQGRTREEARENVIDALRVVLTPDEQLAGEPIDADAEPLELTIA